MRVVFMGTPQFAVPTLQALIEKHDVVGVFTQPDRPAGRGKKLNSPPVKQVALQSKIAVFQPEKINDSAVIEQLRKLQPEVIVVVAYGQILKREILNLPHFGCLNVHASLLPRWRGASPIQTAIVAGDKRSGVTIMQMDKGLDTGDMLYSVPLSIDSQMTAGQLHDELMTLGATALLTTLEQLQSGVAKAVKQNEGEATYAPLIDRKMAAIDWTAEAQAIVNLIRGYNPWPSAHCELGGVKMKIHRAANVDLESAGKPGEVVAVTPDYIDIACAKGALRLLEIQPANSKRMEVSAYLRGHAVTVGQLAS